MDKKLVNGELGCGASGGDMPGLGECSMLLTDMAEDSGISS